uniref:Uncharacterized protein n=1 Tax=Parascaris univalens TaxID=6257 RepID=A0A915AZ25_PARUN
LSDGRKPRMNDLWSSLQREATVISRCLNADVRIILTCNYDADSGSAKQEMRSTAASEGSLHSMPTSTVTAIAAQQSANAANSTSYIRISNPEAQPPPTSSKNNGIGSVISYVSGNFVNGVFVDEPQMNVEPPPAKRTVGVFVALRDTRPQVIVALLRLLPKTSITSNLFYLFLLRNLINTTLSVSTTAI